MSTYKLAKQGVYRTAQGEGRLSGCPMIFVRLAGCRVGCGSDCDTDFRAVESVDIEELAERIKSLRRPGIEYLAITGGEPSEQDLEPLIFAANGLKVALATAGVRDIDTSLIDFVSVSPHSVGEEWVLRRGDQVNFVPGLKGLRLEDLDGLDLSGFPPGGRFVTPLADREGRQTNVRECLEFVSARPGWRLGCQAHLLWGVP